MLKLTERQRVFVMICVNQGVKMNFLQAVRLAGYKGTDGALRVLAHRLGQDEEVQAAMLEQAKGRLKSSTLAAVALLDEMITDESVEPKDRLNAAKMVLDRGGIHALTEHKVEVTRPTDRIEVLTRIMELAKQQNLDPQVLIGNLADFHPSDLRIINGETTHRGETDKEPADYDEAEEGSGSEEGGGGSGTDGGDEFTADSGEQYL